MWEKLIENIWLKLGAILLAFLLWFNASTNKPYEYAFNYSLKLINLPPELILANPLPSKVKVKIQGKGKELLKLLLFEKKILKINAQRFSSGEIGLQLEKGMITIPEGLNLTVIEIFPSEVLKINLQKVEEKKVPVRSKLKFFPQEGYFQKDKVKFSPESIVVRGPSESVGKTNFILTQNKEFQGLKKSLSGSIDLAFPHLFNLEISPQRVDFFVEIEKGEKRRLDGIQIRLINLPRGRTALIEPKTIDLELFGEKETLEKLSPEVVKVYIDCQGLKRGESKVFPTIQIPEGNLLVKSEPDSFKLEIK